METLDPTNAFYIHYRTAQMYLTPYRRILLRPDYRCRTIGGYAFVLCHRTGTY